MGSSFYEDYSEKLKVLGHPIRIRIAMALAGKEHTVNALSSSLDVAQATVSQHLSALKSKGIIEGHRSGTHVTYFFKDPLLKDMVANLYKTLKENGYLAKPQRKPAQEPLRQASM